MTESGRVVRWGARLLYCAVAIACFAVGSGRAEALRIATYNVENYVATNRMTSDGYRKDYPKPEVQKGALRTVIKELNADVLILQEMGSAGHLEELQRDLARDGVSYPHATLLEAGDPDRHVAVLARREPIEIVRHIALEFGYLGGREVVKRGMVEVRLATSVGTLTLFGVHLKSRFTDRPDDPQSGIRRIGEATAVRDAILARFPSPESAMFVVAGDFNDTPRSKTLQRLQRRGKTRIAHLLPAADSRGERWTHAFRKEDNYTRVDHVLVSTILMRAVQGGAVTIFDIPEVRVASDHRPVVITLEFEDAKKAGS
jgi:endonuclease/exonuclease/phosphatase family metal-dependent hydrolase